VISTFQRLAVTLWLAVSTSAALAEPTVMEVIPLKYRTVEEIIPVLRPMLPASATLSGMGSKLIVRATPSSMSEVKQILAALDAAPRRLVISVRQDADLDRSRRGGQVSGRAEVGDSVSVQVPGSPTPPGATARVDGVRAKVYGSETLRTDQVSQQVQVMEGGRALIRVGQSVPESNAQVVDTTSGRRVLRSTEYRDVDTGFYVVPRLNGDQVTLEISTVADSLQSPRSAAVNVQRVQTVVTGRLGEWIEFAGIDQQSAQREDSLLARSEDARRDARRVLLRVDEVGR
jgi:hypothetical protein